MNPVNYAAKYKAGKIKEPEQNESENDFVQRAQYYWGMHISNNCLIGPVVSRNGTTSQFVNGNLRRPYGECRRVAMGMHDVEQFKDLLDKKKSNGKRSLNISWEPIRIVTKYRDMVVDRMISTSISPVPRMSDESSIKLKKKMENRMRLMVHPDAKQMLRGTNVRPSVPEGMEDIRTGEELDYYLETVGITVPKEIEMKDRIDATNKRSKEMELALKRSRDAVALNAYAIHREWKGDTVVHEYIDPENLVCRRSMYQDCRDIDFAGFITYKTIAELRSSGEFDENRLTTISNQSNKYWGQYGSELVSYVGQAMSSSPNQVAVFQFYFIDPEVDCYISGYHPEHGNKVFRKMKDPNSSITGRNAKHYEKVEVQTQYLYKCKWIIGTEYCYDYGKADVVPRKGEPGNKKAILPMTIHIGNELSLVERIIGLDKDIQLDTYNIRKLLTKIPPGPRMIINKAKLKSTMKIGQDKFTILDSLKRFWTDGVFVIETDGTFNIPGIEDDPRGDKVIDFVKVNFGEDVATLHQNIMRNLTLIKQTFGFNDITDGTSNDPRLLKGVVNGMQQVTNSSLKPTLFEYFAFCENMYDDLVATYQTMDPDTTEYQMDIRIESLEERQMLQQDLLQYKEALDPDVYYMVQNIIREGDTAKAQYILSMAVKRAKQQRHQMDMEVQRATGEANAQAAQAKMQGDMQLASHKNDLQKDYKQFEHNLDEQAAQKEFERKKELSLSEKAMMIEGNKEVLRENQ